MHVEIDNQDVAGGTFGEQHQRGDRHVVEGAEAGALRPPRMVAAAGAVAGDAVQQRQPRRQHRATGGQLRPERDAWPNLKADLPLNLGRHFAGNHLFDIVGRMGELQPWCRRRIGHVECARHGQSARAQSLHQQRIFAHREAMIDGEAGVVAGMMNDLQGHEVLSDGPAPVMDFGWPRWDE